MRLEGGRYLRNSEGARKSMLVEPEKAVRLQKEQGKSKGALGNIGKVGGHQIT